MHEKIQKKTKKSLEEVKANRRENIQPHLWKPGQSGNPQGRPKLSEDLKKVREINTHVLKRMISKHFGMTQGELAGVLADENARAIDILIAKTIVVCLENGNIEKAEFLFRRSFGSVQENVKLGVKNLGSKTVEEKLKAGKAAIEFLEAQKNVTKADDDDEDEPL